MKTTGMTRKIDELGRIVLPIEIRRTMDAAPGDLMEIYVENGAIILRKMENSCIFCGSKKDLTEFCDRWVCSHCRGRIAEL